jgi:hypothetical protein
VSGPIVEGSRVSTPLGAGKVTKVTRESRIVFNEPVWDYLFVVKLDDRPDTGMRPVFYSKDVELDEEWPA